MTILAGDVGGTKIVLEAGEIRSGAWRAQLARRYESSDASFADALGEFMREWEATRKGAQRITSACFGAAGPVAGNKVKMTNRPWSVDGDMVMRRFGIARARVVNDLEASARGLELLSPRELRTIQAGKSVERAPCAVLGVGTGLGIAYLVWSDGAYRPIAGEGGHATFAPVTPQQVALAQSIRATRGRVGNEDILSGPGLSRVYQFMSESGQCGTPTPEALVPERISRGAIEEGDSLAAAALDLFIECLGSVAGDHALNVMARGGVYLTGGIVAKILPRLKGERFRAAFCAKGAHSSLLQRIPVRAVTSERLPVLGAARFAADRVTPGAG